MMHKIAELPEEYAIVLQQIDEDGAEDFNELVETLQFERSRLAHIIQSLQHKGLVSLQGDGERGFWIRLSRKGERLMRYLWPESGGLQPNY
jgi:DNA-binding IclR family transcriptional regulator